MRIISDFLGGSHPHRGESAQQPDRRRPVLRGARPDAHAGQGLWRGNRISERRGPPVSWR